MSARELIVLGTASQVPTRARAHNSMLLRWDELGILFDPGEGTQRQMLFAGLAASEVTHVCITHFHGDHALGLAGMSQRFSLDRVAHPIQVIFPESGTQFFHNLTNATLYHHAAELVPVPIAGDGLFEVARAGKHRILAHALEHGVDCYGYRLQEEDGVRMDAAALEAVGVRGPAVSQLMAQGAIEVGGRTVRLDEVSAPRVGQSFALVMDTRPCRGARALMHGADLVAAESTYLDVDADIAAAHFHMTARQAASMAREAGARRLVLTHFSQRYTDHTPFRVEAEAAFGAEVVVANDLTRVSAPPRLTG